MISNPHILKIGRTVVGICIGAGLIYFLYSKNTPHAVGLLITIAAMVFAILSRRAGVYDNSPVFRRLAMVSSRKPYRDSGIAVLCFVATMAATIAVSIGIRDKVLPDNYVTVGFLAVVIIGGIGGMLYFVSGVIGRVFYGPPPR
jgi:hypothetical protein